MQIKLIKNQLQIFCNVCVCMRVYVCVCACVQHQKQILVYHRHDFEISFEPISKPNFAQLQPYKDDKIFKIAVKYIVNRRSKKREDKNK